MVDSSRFQEKLLDENENKKIVGICVYAVLAGVALFMTFINIVTDKGMLTLATGIFAALCLANILLVLFAPRGITIASIIFSAELIVLFTYFLISGSPEGFSAIWICLLPSLGLFFFGRNRGSVVCGVMFFILVILLWTPFGGELLQYEYTASFKSRFPILFVAFHLLALFLETVRVFTYNEMKRMRELYRNLSIRDQLTQMYNRQGMYNAVREGAKKRKFGKGGIVIFDIDDFKIINDTYGHAAGDVVLQDLAAIIQQKLNAVVCRWGGEEFTAFFYDDDVTADVLEELRTEIQGHMFMFEEICIYLTVSMGVFKTSQFDGEHIEPLVRHADDALYEAKRTGKNRVIWSRKSE